jgi:predicted phosphate transport protein (TIGR00153 family)
MSINSILQVLVPKDKKFFPLFEQASENLLAISKVLCEVLNSEGDKRKQLIKEISRLEHVGDEITHQIFHELGSNFITPFDREDIQRLASVLDDVLDFIHGSAKRIELYNIDKIHPSMIKLGELILESAQELNKAIPQLRDMREISLIREACVKINSIENHADDIFDMAVARLFEEETNAIEIIKIKEILSALETATDRAEDAANVLESILIKAY